MGKQKKLIVGITAEGSVNLLLGQMAYFKSLGYKTYLLAPYSERSAKFCENEGCEHLVINIEREISIWKDLQTLWQILKIFNKVKPEIVNLGTPKVSLLGMIAAFILRVPNRIYTCRGFRFEHEQGKKKQILIVMEKITSLLAHKVICISKSVQDLGHQFKIFDHKKSLVILKGSSNGVNLSLFDPEKINQTKRKELVQEFCLEGKFVFGFIGRIVDRKGIQELMGVFDNLYEKNKNLRLLLVGPFEMEQITDKSLFDKANNHPGIINIGRVMQDEVPPYLSLIDVFVLPAWWEGFGNVLIQAAAMGIPVISTHATGTKDAVEDGFNGLLVPVKDNAKLKEAMIQLLEEDEIRKRMGENGKIWAQNFDREMIWKEMDKIYREDYV
ncbi:glycosyltransferase family 4 protein [Shivajiella indica]|uniref:Glycosyltransferase family 4 protein n=1 Tax=Shivajiella indica TaxID=872115 RepID=A0ABW5B6T9_9BACT